MVCKRVIRRVVIYTYTIFLASIQYLITFFTYNKLILQKPWAIESDKIQPIVNRTNISIKDVYPPCFNTYYSFNFKSQFDFPIIMSLPRLIAISISSFNIASNIVYYDFSILYSNLKDSLQ